ncbi:APC13 [Lepeophtheirus salmonis]|uniref:Anaphase-promoting complex subunit 13 n=1 Tax=Lepeophtheirus salmonis TaxID=72036 RepID=A0A7R8CG53_LEPSM|nr:APC13 [Lepeophtheirus salmonis]CAF2812566.1 APC13 [Lepeophtheirus salmonis]
MDSQVQVDGRLLDIIDDNWRKEKLPEDDILVPLGELPDPESDNGNSSESVREQENKWTDLNLAWNTPHQPSIIMLTFFSPQNFSSLTMYFLLYLLIMLHGTHAHNYSSLWCHGSHVDSRQCTFKTFVIHINYLSLSTFKSSDYSKLHISSHNPYEVLLIHVKKLEPLQGSLDRFFIDVLLTILKTLNPLCYGDLIHCSFPRIILNSEITCFEKVHIGNLEDKYSGTSFRELILENLELKIALDPNPPILLLSNNSNQVISEDVMNIIKDLCHDCPLEVISFDLSNIQYLLNALISAKIVISYENFLTAGFLMPFESILLHPLSQEVEESPVLITLLKNRDTIKYRTWIPGQSLPLADFQTDEETLEDERLWIYPSRVHAFECNLEIKSSELFVNLIWDPPLNAQYFHSLTYELLVQGMKSEISSTQDLDFLDQFSVKDRKICVTVNANIYSALKIYILAKTPLEDGFENKGIDTHFICNLDRDIKFS